MKRAGLLELGPPRAFPLPYAPRKKNGEGVLKIPALFGVKTNVSQHIHVGLVELLEEEQRGHTPNPTTHAKLTL